jgi:alkylation response protein AidB-like acyl-CoA dehydrogenase
MKFDFDSEQLALQDSLQRYLNSQYDFEKRRAHLATPFGSSAEIWRGFAAQGFTAIGIPESYGGIGGATEIMLVMEEIGRSLLLEPYLTTVALCAPLVAELGSDAQKNGMLPRVAEGELKLALAHGEPDSRYTLADVKTLASGAGDVTLHGVKHTVVDGATADVFLVTARVGANGPLGVYAVAAGAPGLTTVKYRTQDGRGAADLTLSGAPAKRLGDAGADALPAVERAIERGIAASCAEAVGAIDATCAATVEYTKSRKQFGQPIGRFQALQHRMADMFVYATQARSMSVLATGRLASADAALRRRDIAAAKAYVGKAIRFVSQQAVQLHGGMGMADELAVSHYFKRLTMIGLTFGDVSHHVATVSDAILADAVPAEDVA